MNETPRISFGRVGRPSELHRFQLVRLVSWYKILVAKLRMTCKKHKTLQHEHTSFMRTIKTDPAREILVIRQQSSQSIRKTWRRKYQL